MAVSPDADIETWREVHRHLTLAILRSRDNVAEELAKRRYLLEEINRSPAGGPPTVSSYHAGGRKMPKKAGASSKPTPAKAQIKSTVKKQHMNITPVPPKAITIPLPVGIVNNSLPSQNKPAPMVGNFSPIQKKQAPMAPPHH